MTLVSQLALLAQRIAAEFNDVRNGGLTFDAITGSAALIDGKAEKALTEQHLFLVSGTWQTKVGKSLTTHPASLVVYNCETTATPPKPTDLATGNVIEGYAGLDLSAW